MPPTPRTVPDDVIVSYLTLRKVVGVLGMALPVAVALGGFAVQRAVRVLPSISDYYSLRTRDAFVGILFTVAWFLFTYRGHERKDDVAGNIACLFALGVALSPNSGSGFERAVHYTSAAGLFLALAYFSLFLFTKTSGFPTPQKLLRNHVYRTCGVTMLGCILMIALYQLALAGSPVDRLNPVFWLESLALWAFGISWLVKGEAVLQDA